MSQDHLHLNSSLFISFEEIKTQKILKTVNDGGTYSI